VVEDPAVERVLRERPGQDAQGDEAREGERAQEVGRVRAVGDEREDREPEDEGRGWMDAREALDERGLEHLAGLGALGRGSLLGRRKHALVVAQLTPPNQQARRKFDDRSTWPRDCFDDASLAGRSKGHAPVGPYSATICPISATGAGRWRS